MLKPHFTIFHKWLFSFTVIHVAQSLWWQFCSSDPNELQELQELQQWQQHHPPDVWAVFVLNSRLLHQNKAHNVWKRIAGAKWCWVGFLDNNPQCGVQCVLVILMMLLYSQTHGWSHQPLCGPTQCLKENHWEAWKLYFHCLQFNSTPQGSGPKVCFPFLFLFIEYKYYMIIQN